MKEPTTKYHKMYAILCIFPIRWLNDCKGHILQTHFNTIIMVNNEVNYLSTQEVLYSPSPRGSVNMVLINWKKQ